MSAAAAITAGAGLVDNLVGAISQGRSNRRNREFTLEMWNKQNEYNHPYNQMQRFREAGLNPHLVYAQGNNGNASAPMPSENKPFKTNFLDTAMMYTAQRKQQTEIDNLNKGREVMEADINLKKANAMNAISNSNFTDEKKSQLEQMYGLTRAQAEANLRQTDASTNSIISAMNNAVEQLGINKKLANFHVLKIQAEIPNIVAGLEEIKSRISLNNMSRNKMYTEDEINKLVRDKFWKHGINPNSQGVDSLIKMGVDSIVKPLKSDLEDTAEGVKSWFKSKRVFGRNLWDFSKE